MDKITLLGLVAAICTTISYLPQAIKTIQTKEVKNISLIMYSILTFGVLLWLIYGIFIKNTPVILANGITFIFVATTLVLVIKYKNKS